MWIFIMQKEEFIWLSVKSTWKIPAGDEGVKE